MNLVAKVKCQCLRWIRIRDTSIPTGIVQCWNCGASIQITWINKTGGNAKIILGTKTITVSDVDVESLELP